MVGNVIQIIVLPGNRVIAPLLTDAPLRMVNSLNGQYMVVWRTYINGRRRSDDGSLWLLKNVNGNGFTIQYERFVCYAMNAAVSNLGDVAWSRSDGHKSAYCEIQAIDIDGEYIIENERFHKFPENIEFSESSNHLAILCSREKASVNRGFVWNIETKKLISSFKLLLTGGTRKLEITDKIFKIETTSDKYVELSFDGFVIFDNRFTDLKNCFSLNVLENDLGELPSDQLSYVLNELNKFIQTLQFSKLDNYSRQWVNRLRKKIETLLGFNINQKTSITLALDDEIIDFLNHTAISGDMGNTAESVAINLLTMALRK